MTLVCILQLSQGVGKALLSISGSSIDDPTRKYTCAISNKAGKARKSVSVYTLGEQQMQCIYTNC